MDMTDRIHAEDELELVDNTELLPHLYTSRKDHIPQKKEKEITKELLKSHEFISADRDKIGRNIEVVLHCLCEKLQHKGYTGTLIPIGSSHDNTRVSANTDFDYLYEVQSAPGIGDVKLIQLEDSGVEHTRLVTVGCGNLNPWSVYLSFSKAISNVCTDFDRTNFPDRSSWGGFAQPEFSGIKRNEPAVTLVFKWRNNHSEYEIISVDITIALKIPRSEAELVENIHSICKKLPVVCDLSRDVVFDKCHLVPVWPHDGDQWFITTAVLEQAIFRSLPDCPHKCMIKECKSRMKCTTDDINKWFTGQVDISPPFQRIQNWIIESLDKYRRLAQNPADQSTIAQLKELREILKDILSIGHIFLPPNVAVDYTEIPPKYVSFNSSVIKYRALNREIPILPTDCCKSGRLASWLLESIAEEPVEHAFLSYNIRTIGLSCIIGTNVEQFESLLKQYITSNGEPQ